MKTIHDILRTDTFTPGAHRGASGELPENTLEAYRRAWELLPGCLMETDVRVTRDGHCVMMHDALLESRTSGTGPVAGASLEEIKKLDAGYNVSLDSGKTFPFRGKGYRMPTLAESLEELPDALFSVDIKDNSIEAAERVIRVIRETDAARRVIMGSFHDRIMAWVRENHPDLARIFSRNSILRYLGLLKTGLAFLYRERGQGLFVPEYHFGPVSERDALVRWKGVRVVTKRLIRDAHKKGIPVFVWTVNREENMERLLDMGVNGIITDCPGRLKRVMESRGMKTG